MQSAPPSQAAGSSNPSTPLAATLRDTQRIETQETVRAPTPPCKGEMGLPSEAESVALDSASAKLEAKKRRAKAEAKLRRMCEPKAVSGKMEVDENIATQWADLAGGRDRLIQMMVDAENDKACWGLMHVLQHDCIPVESCLEDIFYKKVDEYKKEEEFKKLLTKGGFYSEADMKKPFSEGGLGFSASLG